METRTLLIWLAIILAVTIGGYLLVLNLNPATKGPDGTNVQLGQLPDDARLATCQANRMTIRVAVNAYEATRNDPPRSISDLTDSGLLRTNPTCPSGGSYSLGSDGEVSCSVHGK
jgi:hypothetical protein